MGIVGHYVHRTLLIIQISFNTLFACANISKLVLVSIVVGLLQIANKCDNALCLECLILPLSLSRVSHS
jgi:hypothetical protein